MHNLYKYYSNSFCYCQVSRNNFCYNSSMATFNERLKELRIEKNISQLELSKVVNMSKMAISHWESGHSEPSISQLKELSKFFGVTVDYLIGNTNF